MLKIWSASKLEHKDDFYMWPCHTVPDEQEVDEVDSEDLLTTKRPKTDTKQRYTYCTSKTPCLNVHAHLSHNVVGTCVYYTSIYDHTLLRS